MGKRCSTLVVETDEAIYDIELCQVEIEITDRCNMLCEHCRVGNNSTTDMPIELIARIMQFSQLHREKNKEIVISGGEPLLHPQFPLVMQTIKEKGGQFVALTTNGYFLNDEYLKMITGLDFKKFTFSISLDSLDSQDHDNFRGRKGAFDRTIEAFRTVTKYRSSKLDVSMRTSLRPHQVSQMRDFTDFAYNLGCDRINFSAIQPVGRARDNKLLWMNQLQKKQFIEQVHELDKIHPRPFLVRTNDPLKCLIDPNVETTNSDDLIFGGCIAGTATFNVRADGTMTPCALLDVPLMNVSSMSIDEITANYQSNPIIKNMLDMKLSGKCRKCSRKYQCGGCRARALACHNDFLAEDPDCWI